jgi:DNA-binding CsgD family transcriptional regulator/tetratricopeptide (TPR) repeat protein
MLFGRDRELARVGALLEGARDSRSSALVVVGEAGVGKSELLAYAAAQASDMPILRAVGLESESQLAFAALHQLLRPVLDRADRLPPNQAAALGGAFGLADARVDDRFLISIAVLSLLADVAEDGGLLCLVDDAHWLDEPSLDALVFAARRLEAEGVAVLMAVREGERRELRPTGLPELRLEGLEPEAAAALLAHSAGPSLAAGVEDALLASADGNPLALVELPSSLTGAQLSGREPLPSPLPVSGAVEAAFLARVHRLPEDVQELLLLAAADDTGDLGTILRSGAAAGVDASTCDAAESARLIHIDGSRLTFRHPLIRSVVYRAAPFSRRQAAHRALAVALDAATEPDRRSWHNAAATLGPDAEIADGLERSAARATARGGHATAAAALERAAELSPDDASRGRRLIAAAEASWLAGRHQRVLALLARGEPFVTDPALRATVAHLRGSVQLDSGDASAAHATLVPAAARLAHTDPGKALEMLVRAGEAAWFTGRTTWSDEIERIVVAMHLPDDDQRLRASLLVGAGAVLEGDFERGAPALREALQLGEGAVDPRTLLDAGAAAGDLGLVATARAIYERAVHEARSAGAVGALPLALALLAMLQAVDGRFAAAGSTASEGLRLARETEQETIACLLLAALAWLDAVHGREEQCRAHAGEAMQIATARGLRLQTACATWALGYLDLGQGRLDDAVLRIGRIEADPAAGYPLLWRYAIPEFVEAAARAGSRDRARPAVATFAHWADLTGSPWARPILARLEALLADGQAATAIFQEALRRHADGGSAFDRARTQLLYGELLRRNRRRTDAREQLVHALETFEQLGAAPWIERAAGELRATGATARRRDPSSLDELTPQELQIARFVTEGATNRQIATQLFLSPRTIDYHLRNVFRKLGIASRHDLAKVLPHEDGSRAVAEALGA